MCVMGSARVRYLACATRSCYRLPYLSSQLSLEKRRETKREIAILNGDEFNNLCESY